MQSLNEERIRLVHLLERFRPSDREAIIARLRSAEGRESVYRGYRLYVERWEKADWIEDYAIELRGKWIATLASPALVQRLQRFTSGSRTRARRALGDGLAMGLKDRSATVASRPVPTEVEVANPPGAIVAAGGAT